MALYDGFLNYGTLKQFAQQLNSGQSVYPYLPNNKLNTTVDKEHYFFSEVLGRAPGRFSNLSENCRTGNKFYSIVKLE